MKRLQLGVKRALDVAAAAAGLAVAGPLLAATALSVRATMGSPVLFRQARPGFRETPFELLKFRTMRAAQPDEGVESDSRRITRLGAFLRKSSLDELPTLINVLRGDMSLVGPRPLLMQYLERYSPEQRRRHDAKPGITGWAQVNGRNQLSWEDKFALDVWYVDNWSLALDLKILLATARTVLAREGISAAGHATMPEFRGSDTARQAS